MPYDPERNVPGLGLALITASSAVAFALFIAPPKADIPIKDAKPTAIKVASR